MSTPPTPLFITYRDPDGTYWNLSDRSMSKGYVCSAIAGIEGLPVMMQTIPLLDGTAIPSIYLPQTGTIGIAILVGRPASDNQNDYYNMLDMIVRAFYNRRNEIPVPGTLIIQRPDGNSRSIPVYTTSGLNTPEVGVNDMTLFSLSLSTPDPFWSGLDRQIEFASTNYPGILPILPIQLNAAHSIGDSVITLESDMPAYPIWVITGPGTPTVKNNTTGRAWGLNTAVKAGQQVQVNTARGKQAVFDVATKANMWNELVFSGPHDLWPLVSGKNSITITIPDATVATSVLIQYTDRWARA